jgi:F-type H+-transporting ATPase subunit alpha
VSVPQQIAVLLALTGALFDAVPIDEVGDAERAVQEAASNIPEDICARFETATRLADEDRNAIIAIAREALLRFQASAESKRGSKLPSQAVNEAAP